jgi:hypothetical protein
MQLDRGGVVGRMRATKIEHASQNETLKLVSPEAPPDVSGSFRIGSPTSIQMRLGTQTAMFQVRAGSPKPFKLSWVHFATHVGRV